MYIKNSYKYEKDGVIGVSANVPDGATVLETLEILYSEPGYTLQCILNDEIIGSSIWLHDGDVQENYREIPGQEEE